LASDIRHLQDVAAWVARVEAARTRIYSVAKVTPVSEFSMPHQPGTTLLVKREDLQTTGSFKVRGATNKVLSLTAEQASRRVITSSTGNHGLAVAAAARYRGIEAEVFVSQHVSEKKLDRMREYGARIRFAGDNPLRRSLLPVRKPKRPDGPISLRTTTLRLSRGREPSPLNCSSKLPNWTRSTSPWEVAD